jgi:peptidoglycan LD-endopeptidase LytH
LKKRLFLHPYRVVVVMLLAFPAFAPAGEMDPAEAWHLLYPKIRDGLISREEAQGELKTLEIALRNIHLRKGGSKDDGRLVFPVEGYSATSIGGKRGSGFQPRGYNFFDGDRHKGHPSHDIFILDRNQDGLDDATGKPALVVSSSPGIVVSTNTGWMPSSPVRGGNYVWVFEPGRSRYFYYAHLDDVLVRVGHFVSKGDPLGTVGRTGLNAYPRRSPTHLHFTVHQSDDGDPKPINPYSEFVKEKGISE